MNLLQLCNRAIREGDVSGGALSSVAAQSGERNDVIEWVKSAYREICQAHDEWKFLRSSFTVNTVASTQTYLPSTATDSRLSVAVDGATTGFHYWRKDTFRIYLQSAGVATQREFGFM